MHLHMGAALALARRGLGRVWPNPTVGCVVVKDGHVVGRGFTQPGGRPHAEPLALEMAGEAARGADVYVSLEPCSHYGKTPPCADALVRAGVARVIAAAVDPDPRVSGRGLARLREAGVEVVEGVRRDEAEALNAGFFSRVRTGRPLVTLKCATTLDGRIALASGESKWITGPEARRRGHLLRCSHDAILIGSGTALADDPTLTCRLPGLEDCSPVRVVLDGSLRLPVTSALVRSAKAVPLWIVTRPGHDSERLEAFTEHGAEVLEAACDESGALVPEAVLNVLGARGITRVLVEGGGRVAAAMLRDGCVDGLAWFRAGKVIGGDGRAAVADLALDRLAAAPDFAPVSFTRVGDDVLEVLEKR
ncbi:bifunctional diaminohydroxyphosphoribosylaminopyrimidine deaminase/5-amino-6-(5-phosphoribosylamino)uracil reductase RibD [Caenispirillum salinarum]|uniref:bifunctional diaminohydroxyphosphoribosylaminopyrimidine deaminase/5-amino-6-(5-phosphoribosylamino)uracil reductase RibD n=1 Tax=Caenispirillum salinarum TaxID=859058 RepID=UPI00384D43C2